MRRILRGGKMSDLPEFRDEFRMVWTYPYLEGRGEVAYGKPAETKELAIGKTNDEAWSWAGKLVGFQKRKVAVGEWQDE